MENREVVNQVLDAARMVVTEGLGKGRPAPGFFIIVGDAKEILADEQRDEDRPDIIICKYGEFVAYLDRRGYDLKLGDCLGARKRTFLNLFNENAAVVIDQQTGHVCCGGFFVRNVSSGIKSGGARQNAASAMATQAGGCFVVLASEEICGADNKPVPQNAALRVFNHTRFPSKVPVVVVSEIVPEQTLEQWLHPLKFNADLCRHNRDFVEGTRQWILDDLKAWLGDPHGSPCRILLAGPGFGKTAIVARLYQMTTSVLAIHLCRYNDSFKRDPRRMIASLAYQIAQALPQFRDALRLVREAEGGATDAYSLRPTARELADCLLLNPLGVMAPANKGSRYVIIIDALDEALDDSKEDFIRLVAFEFRNLPPWIAVLVTARPNVDIVRRLAPLRPTVLDAAAHRDKCDADVRIYLRSFLAERFKDEGSLTSAIETISIKSEGLFLYLHCVRDMIAIGEDIDAVPIGLEGVFKNELERALGPVGLGDKNCQVRRVVEAIIASQVPVHVHDELPGLSGVPNVTVLKLVSRLSGLLRTLDNGRVSFYKSFVDWLTRDAHTFDSSAFIIDRRAAHRRLASVCSVPLVRLLSEEADRFESDAHAVAALEQFAEARRCVVDDCQQSLVSDEYALRWTVKHLVEAGGLENVSLALLYSLRFLLKRAPQIETLISDAVLLFPTTALLHRTLRQVQNNVRLCGAKWLAEELWQRLLNPAESLEIVDLKRLARDAQSKARADLMFSARRAYFTAANLPLHCVLDGHSREITGVTGFMDAEGQPWVASWSDDYTVRIWDPIRGGEAVNLLKGHSSRVNSVTAFYDAYGRTWVASCSDDRTVRIWDPIEGSGMVRVLEGHEHKVNCVAVFQDATGCAWVASGSFDTTVRIWDPIKGGGAVHVLKGHSHCVNGVTAFQDANGHPWVASCSNDTTVRIWDPIVGSTAVYVLEGHSARVNGVTAFMDASGRTWVASYCDDTTVRIWDPIKGGELVNVLEGHTGQVRGVTAFVDANGHPWVASCSDDKTVRIWDPIKGGELVNVLEGHTGQVTGVTAFVDANGHPWVASCSDDKTVRIWDPIKGGLVNVLEGHTGQVRGVAAFIDTKGYTWVTSCSDDKTVFIWDPIKGDEAVHLVEGHSADVNGLTAFMDAKGCRWVASCSDDTTVRIWDPIKGGTADHVLCGHSHSVRGVTAFVDAKGHTWVASCSTDATIRIWEPIKGSGAVQVLKGHAHAVIGVNAFVDAKGQTWLASCSDDTTVRIWDPINGGTAVHVLCGHSLSVTGVTAFVDAKGHPRVVSCSDDTTVRIWDAIKGGTAVHVLCGHSLSVRGVTAFVDAKGQPRVVSCSDDKTVSNVIKGHTICVDDVKAFVRAKGQTWVATCSEDKTVRIWDPITGGIAVHVLRGHTGGVNGVTSFMDANGHTVVASCSYDDTVRIWDPINGVRVKFVIPLEIPPLAISAISAYSSWSQGVNPACLILGHKNGLLSYWDFCLQSLNQGGRRLSRSDDLGRRIARNKPQTQSL